MPVRKGLLENLEKIKSTSSDFIIPIDSPITEWRRRIYFQLDKYTTKDNEGLALSVKLNCLITSLVSGITV